MKNVIVTTVSEWADGQGWAYEDDIIAVEGTDESKEEFCDPEWIKRIDIDLGEAPENLKVTCTLYAGDDEWRECPLATVSAWGDEIKAAHN